MPEGPEVYFLAQDLGEYVGLTCTEIKKYKYSKIHGVDVPFLFKYTMYHGKELYWGIVHNGVESNIKFNLGLFGTFSKSVTNTTKDKGYSLCFVFGDKKLYYTDRQNFSKINNIGSEIITKGVDVITSNKDDLLKWINDYKGSIGVAKFLLLQSYLSGIGNYLKSDILYVANIKYDRPMNTLSRMEKDHLVDAIKTVIEDVLDKDGSAKYPGIRKGRYDFLVYTKSVAPNGEPVKCVQYGGRSTYYVE
jgi:formamidopyrimidine-DNA glycosylase